MQNVEMKCDYKTSWESGLFYQMNINILHNENGSFRLLTNIVVQRENQKSKCKTGKVTEIEVGISDLILRILGAPV